MERERERERWRDIERERDGEIERVREYIFIIYLNYVQRMSTDQIKEKGFIFKKKRRYTIETRTD